MSGDKVAKQAEEATSLVADSKVVAFWTLFSRVTGFARVAVMAAVLGPTFFGNLFQTTYHIPAIISEILSGSLIAAILVPSLVRCLERRDPEAACRLAGGFLGVMFIAGSAVAVSILVGAPYILSLITAAVADPAIRAQQQEVGWLLLLMLIPQIFLYSLNATNVAIQHAHRRFALASAGPIVENLGIVAVLISSAIIFGAGTEIDEVTTAQVLWLGIGCTGSVALQSIVQAWGAYRAGTVVIPRFGRFDPELRRVTGLLLPSSGYAILNGLVFLALFVVAGRIPGGALAVQIGWNVFNLPVALCARPVVAAQLPRLSSHRDDRVAFNQIYRGSLGLVAFLTLPVTILLAGLGDYAARLIAYGEMSDPNSIAMIGAAIMGMGVGVIGNSVMLIGTSASYALDRPWQPFQSQVVWAVIVAAGMALAWTSMSGVAFIFALTLSVSVGYLIGGAYLHLRQACVLPPVKDYTAMQFLTDIVVAVLATFPAILVCSWLIEPSQSVAVVALVAGVAVSLSGFLYLLMQWARGSSEFSAIFTLGGLKFANGS